MSGSIARGYAPSIGISPGELSEGVTSLSDYLDSTKPDVTAGLAEPAPRSEPAPEQDHGTAFGTGFRVSGEGDYLTNAHVVEGCKVIKVGDLAATVAATDESFDLALLHVDGEAGANPAHFAEKPARLNSDITVVGYPLPDLLGGLNVTRGSVTSLKGMGGDAVRMQISAPVQPGNSGGPVLNGDGLVVGVVVSKLDAKLVSDAMGDIPQNVNFAIRAEIAKLFLYQNGVEPIEAQDAEPLAPETIADQAQDFTRLITCD
jgi:serine protease Do